MTKATLVLGASTNPDRFSYMAIKSLVVNQHEVFAVGLREGKVLNIPIQRPFPELPSVHTVTIYVGQQNQPMYYDFILGLNPRRVIFNPGSENEEFEQQLSARGVHVLHACTLVMLQQGIY